MPDFRNRDFLLDHIRHTMAFYHPRAIDPRGGFFHFFRDDGSVYDPNTRHLVSSTRFVFNYAMAYRRFGDAAYLRAVEHGTAFLRERHRNASTSGYAWLLDGERVADATNHCYGLAFVLLAYAHASMAGVERGTRVDRRDVRSDGASTSGRRLPACTPTKPPRTGRRSFPTAARTPTCTPAKRMLAAFDATGESALSRSRAATWRETSRYDRQRWRTDWSGSTTTPTGRWTGTTTRTTRPTSSVPGATSPGISPSGRSCC